MSKMHWLLGFAMLLGVEQPALACRGPFAHSYILLETPPSRLPKGAVLLSVSVARRALVGGMGEVEPVEARITGARNKRLVGKRVVIRPRLFSSCDHWAESERAGHVVGFLRRTPGKLVIIPVAYRSKRYRSSDEDQSVGIDPDSYRTVK